VNQSKDEDPCHADLGIPVSGPGLDLCLLLHGHGRLEDRLYRRAGWELHHISGLVLVQSVEGLLHGLHFHIQLLRLPCAVVRGRYGISLRIYISFNGYYEKNSLI